MNKKTNLKNELGKMYKCKDINLKKYNIILS